MENKEHILVKVIVNLDIKTITDCTAKSYKPLPNINPVIMNTQR